MRRFAGGLFCGRRGFLLSLLLTAAAIALSWRFTGCSLGVLIRRSRHFSDLVVKMFPPQRDCLPEIWEPLKVSLQMSLAGTALGSLAALICAPFCADLGRGLSLAGKALRMALQVLRAFPALILALAATFLTGLGAFAGALALTVYTFAIMTRLTAEDMESAPSGAWGALRTIGAGKLAAFCRALLPEILPSFFTNALYLLETNLRHSAILGYVGAGGIGLLLSEKISWREYSQAGMILICLAAAAALIETASLFAASVLRGEGRWPPAAKRCLAAAMGLALCWGVLSIPLPDLSRVAPGTAAKMLAGLASPDWGYFFRWGEEGLAFQLAQTLCIALLGTAAGAVPALFFAFLSARAFSPAPLACAARGCVMAVRSVPFVIYGLVMIRVTGPGAFAGVLTMAVCSIGLLSKRFTESLDSLDLRPYGALRACGAGRLAAACRAVLPQLWPQFASAVIYRFDVNIREASVLGLVGAGGIGSVMVLSMNRYAWETTGAVFLGLVLLVWGADAFSRSLRRRLR